MKAQRKRHPIVLSNISNLIGGMVGLSILGCLLAAVVVLFATEPRVPACGCNRVVIVTMADRIAGMSIFGSLGLGVFFICYCVARMRRRALKSIPESVLCQKFGLEPEALRSFAETRGIQPRFVIDSHPHYELGDFGEAATLLRASAPGAGPKELLRAFAQSGSQSPEELLRADPRE